MVANHGLPAGNGAIWRQIQVAPKTVDTSERAAALVMNIRGAVAFMDAEQVRKDAKILKIDDLLPRQKGYPLH